MNEKRKINVFTMIGAMIGGAMAVVAAKLASDPKSREKVQKKFEDLKTKFEPATEKAIEDTAVLESKVEHKIADAEEKVAKKVSYLQKTAVKSSRPAVKSAKKIVKKAASKKTS